MASLLAQPERTCGATRPLPAGTVAPDRCHSIVDKNTQLCYKQNGEVYISYVQHVGSMPCVHWSILRNTATADQS
jgi:hypothetical protein